MDNSQCCRTCLSVQNLNHIFAIEKDSEKLSEVIFITTGVKVELSDNLPKYICTQCMSFINECHKFRQKCRDTERTLLEKFQQKPFCKVKEEETPKFTTTIEDKKINYESFGNDFHDPNYKINLANNNIKLEEGKPKNKTENTSKDAVQEEITNKFVRDSEKEIKVCKKYRKSKDAEENLELSKLTKKYVRKKVITKANKEDMNVEDKSEENGYKCELCPRVFKLKTSMRNHKRNHNKRVVCEHCGKQFSEPYDLLRHCRARHGYEKEHKCSYCDYRGVNADQVRVHERTHTGEKPFACAQCGASFSRRSVYRQHEDSHLPTKTVQCDLCPAKFKSITLMRIHRNKHTAKKYTYFCGVCDNNFATRYNVVIHLKRIHSITDSNKVVKKNITELGNC